MKHRVYERSPRVVRSVYQYAKRALGRDVHARIDSVALRHIARYLYADPLTAHRDVLDAACGSGYGSSVLGSSRSYRGLDLDRGALREAQRWFPEKEFIHGSVFSIPVGDSAMSAVTSFETLEHVPKPEDAMAEFARVLAAGGVFVGSIPINHPDRVHHVRPYSAREARDIFLSDPRFDVLSFCVQGIFDFTPIPVGEVPGLSTGTLLAVLRMTPLELATPD